MLEYLQKMQKKADLAIFKKPPFIQVDLEITNVCNARCGFCRIWEKPGYNAPQIPAKTWIKTLSKLNSFTKIEYVCIAGGEPFLYDELMPFIREMSKLKIVTTIVTNGSMVTKDMCHELVESGLANIDFSIDNFSRKHNKARGIKNLFERCVESIYYIKKIKPDMSVGISSIIYEDNIRDIPIFLKWALTLPIDKINFQAYSTTNISKPGWWKNDPLWPQDEETIQKTMDYLAKQAQLNPGRIYNHPWQFKKYKDYFLNPSGDLKIKCPAGTFSYTIDALGNVIGCINEKPVGNILKQDPVKLYKKEFERIRKKASTCKENCFFLINCYFPLHWKKWDSYAKGMVKL
jgi:MoaA/NifB/PqqE/SkfB family radical SAM enzyme